MKILAMTASFGTLQNARIELGEGLTLIEAPNGAGKSTWCAFLRAMLYGIPTGQRDKQGYIAEKNRYQPWGGGALEGSMDLLRQGRAITICRGPKGSTPFGAFSAVYSGTGEPVSDLTGENCGEKLLGVSREVYERSAFVGQGGAAMGASAELEKRIASLVSSGEEDVSYSEVAKRLRDWQNRRKHNATGSIPKLENERSVLQESLLRQENARNRSEDAKREIDLLTLRRDALALQAQAHRSLANEARRAQYDAATADLSAAQTAAATLRAELEQVPQAESLRAAQGDLAYLRTLEANLKLTRAQEEEALQSADARRALARDPLFPDMTAEGAREQVSADAARISAALAAAAKAEHWRWFSGGIALLFLSAVAGLGWFFLPALRLPLLGGCLLAFLVCAGAGFVVGSKKAKAQRALARLVLEQYGAEHAEDLPRLADAYALRCRDAEEADRRAAEVTAAREKLEGERRDTLQSLLNLVHGFEPNVTDVFGISAALSRALGLRERLTAADVRLEGAQRLVSSLPAPIGAPPAPGMVSPENGPMETAAALGAAERELARLQTVVAQARGELSTLGDPALFLCRSEELEEELSRRRAEYEGLSLAQDCLNRANEDLQARFSPALNAEAGKFLAALTGGKYDKVLLTRDFEVLAEEHGSPLARRALLLSQGTAEQVYLSARLAVCTIALPAQDPAPLVLDDALDCFDDARMALALDCLQALAKERQILLFSCQGRERAALADATAVRIISL